MEINNDSRRSVTVGTAAPSLLATFDLLRQARGNNPFIGSGEALAQIKIERTESDLKQTIENQLNCQIALSHEDLLDLTIEVGMYLDFKIDEHIHKAEVRYGLPFSQFGLEIELLHCPGVENPQTAIMEGKGSSERTKFIVWELTPTPVILAALRLTGPLAGKFETGKAINEILEVNAEVLPLIMARQEPGKDGTLRRTSTEPSTLLEIYSEIGRSGAIAAKIEVLAENERKPTQADCDEKCAYLRQFLSPFTSGQSHPGVFLSRKSADELYDRCNKEGILWREETQRELASRTLEEFVACNPHSGLPQLKAHLKKRAHYQVELLCEALELKSSGQSHDLGVIHLAKRRLNQAQEAGRIVADQTSNGDSTNWTSVAQAVLNWERFDYQLFVLGRHEGYLAKHAK